MDFQRLTGAQPTVTVLWRQGPLGPCAAVVELAAIRTRAGDVVFQVTERWDPRQPGRGEIDWSTIVRRELGETTESTEARARELAGRAADRWRAGSARSDELAPNGVLVGELDWRASVLDR